MKLLYLVGFSLKKLEGRTIGTSNKFKELNKLVEEIRLYDISKSVAFRVLYKYTKSQLLAKLFAIVEINFRILFSILFSDKPDIILCRDFPFAFRKLLTSKNVKFVSEVHADIEQEIKLTKSSFLQFIASPYVKLLNAQISSADGVVFNHPLLQEYMENKLALKQKNIYTYNGSDIASFEPLAQNECRSKLSIPVDEKILVFVGSVAVWHGIEYLLETFDALSKKMSCKLYVVGGANQEYLESVKARFNNPNTVFVGPVSREISKYYINAADICMLPVNNVRVSPGSPIKLFDYMACGKPIITQENVIGYSDVVEENDLGLAVDFHNATAASEAIMEYFDWLHGKEAEVLEHIRKVAVNHFSWKNVAEKWVSYFNDCTVKRSQFTPSIIDKGQ